MLRAAGGMKGVIPIFNVTEVLCLQGNAAAEDRVGADERYIFAIDGASGLNGCRVTDADSDAAWLAEGMCSYLAQHLQDTDRTISEIMAGAAEKLRSEYAVHWANSGQQGQPDYPSAGVAVFRICGDWLEYFGLGDCDAMVETQCGDVIVLEETALPALDRSAIDQMVEYAKKHGCTMLQARAALNSVLIRNRDLRNTAEGYWIFDPTGVGIPHARTTRWPLTEVKGAAVVSDGFAQLAEPFGVVPNMVSLYHLMKQKGLAALAEDLLEMQNADPDCMHYPRFKRGDDTSAVLAEINESCR